MIKHFCDFCGKEMDEKKSFVIKITGADNLLGTIKKEACETCGEILLAGSLHFGLAKEKKREEQENFRDTHDPSGGDLPAEDQARQQEENDKEKKKGTPRRTVDYGKLLALRNAGWSLKKIAEEVHMTESGVSLAIRKAKEEKLKNEGGNL